MSLLPYSDFNDKQLSSRSSRSRFRDNSDQSAFGDDFFGLGGDSFFSNNRRSNTSSIMSQMDSMMNGMMGPTRDPFGHDPFFGGSPYGNMLALQQPQIPIARVNNQMSLSPFGSMGSMMASMENMSREGSCHTYSSSSVMTMSTGPDGRPQIKGLASTNSNGCHWRDSATRGLQVYQATSSSRGVPGGVRETKRTVCDSSSGVRKMAIGHHINDRSHVIEKEMRPGGDLEERQEFVNLDEEEAPEFDQEFKRMTQQNFGQGMLEHHPRQHRTASQPSHRSTYMPALPAPSSRPDDQQRHRDRGTHRRNY